MTRSRTSARVTKRSWVLVAVLGALVGPALAQPQTQFVPIAPGMPGLVASLEVSPAVVVSRPGETHAFTAWVAVAAIGRSEPVLGDPASLPGLRDLAWFVVQHDDARRGTGVPWSMLSDGLGGPTAQISAPHEPGTYEYLVTLRSDDVVALLQAARVNAIVGTARFTIIVEEEPAPVVAPSPRALHLTGPGGSIDPGTTVSLQARLVGAEGSRGVAPSDLRFEVVGPAPVAIDAEGRFLAPSDEGTYTVVASLRASTDADRHVVPGIVSISVERTGLGMWIVALILLAGLALAVATLLVARRFDLRYDLRLFHRQFYLPVLILLYAVLATLLIAEVPNVGIYSGALATLTGYLVADLTHALRHRRGPTSSPT